MANSTGPVMSRRTLECELRGALAAVDVPELDTTIRCRRDQRLQLRISSNLEMTVSVVLMADAEWGGPAFPQGTRGRHWGSAIQWPSFHRLARTPRRTRPGDRNRPLDGFIVALLPQVIPFESSQVITRLLRDPTQENWLRSHPGHRSPPTPGSTAACRGHRARLAAVGCLHVACLPSRGYRQRPTREETPQLPAART